MQKVFLFIADGFEEVEAITPLDYLRRCGADLTLVGVGSTVIRSARSLTLTCDCSLESLCTASLGSAEETAELEQLAAKTALVILPGGLPNSRALAGSERLHSFVTAVVRCGGLAAAICAAPALVLGGWGLLTNKQFTCYPGMGEDLPTPPIKGTRVIRDGQFITACGAGAAEEFSFALINALYGDQKTAEIRASIIAR